MRLINTGPVILVSCGPADKPNAITLAWSMNVSHKPPMLAVAIAPSRYSHELITQSGEFCVNVPGRELGAAVMYMGSRSGRDGDKFAPAGLTPEPAASIGTVSIAECPGHIECRVAQSAVAGDHTVFIAEILDAYADPECFTGKRWTLSSPRGQTLHHLGENFFGALQNKFQV